VANVTRLLETPRLAVGEFECPVGDPAWTKTNHIGDEPHVVFPLLPVVIDQLRKGSVLATPNHAILYDADQLYQRELRSDHGDRCVFVSLSPEALEPLREELGGDVFGAIHVPSDQRTYLERHFLVSRLRSGTLDPGEAEASAFDLVRSTLRRRLPERRRGRARTLAAHRELAEAAKAEITRAFAVPLSLEQLSRTLRTSRFHLARVFRAETGFSIDGYQRALRLRVALERLPTHSDGLTELAFDLGFSSHSHFSETFRREFGLSPSSLQSR
jgi:AraC-like DNA-binding protein